jgi:membrane fusion protein, multidrug efflux system
MVTLRGEVPNPDNFLMPGMFARAELVQGVITNAVTVPQRTVARGPGGSASVLVVDAQNKVEMRPIEIDREIAAKVVVARGLKQGEQIIVEGSQKAPPGSTVKTVAFNPTAVAGTQNSKGTNEPHAMKEPQAIKEPQTAAGETNNKQASNH